MINAARTLLLNMPGPYQGSTPGEEVIAEDYRPKALSPQLTLIHNTLFGLSPDRTFLNYRGRQFLQLLHATELSEYLYDLDPRITYLPFTATAFAGVFVSNVSRLSGPVAKVYLQGRQIADEYLGRTGYRWRIEVLDADTIRVDRRLNDRTIIDHTVTVTDGLATTIPLHGSALSLQLSTGTASSDLSPVIGAALQVDCTARPERSLSTIYTSLRGVGQLVTEELFGVLPVEPYRTFANLWTGNPHMPYALGGLLTAFIYRVNELERRA